MSPRRPADIAREWRQALRLDWPAITDLADELEALDARWPTADEIAELRGDALYLAGGTERMERVAARLTTLADRLDPPAPQAADDVDPWALAAGLVNAASAKDYDAFAYFARRVRAALDARGRR